MHRIQGGSLASWGTQEPGTSLRAHKISLCRSRGKSSQCLDLWGNSMAGAVDEVGSSRSKRLADPLSG